MFIIQFPTKNVQAKIIIKLHRFQFIDQKLILKGFFRPLVMTHLLKIQFPTKKFLAKNFEKMHRFRLIDQTLNSKGFFRPLVLTRLFKIQIVQNFY